MRTSQRLRPSRGLRAFTLIEVMLALAIFMILAGAVFFSVQSVTTASAVLGIEQLRSRKTDAFLSWCRRGFRSISGRSEIILRTRETGSAGLAVELIIRRAPGAFSLGEIDGAGGDVILGAIPDGKGGATLSVARFPGSWSLEDATKQLRNEDWFPLLENIRTLQWTFWNEPSGEFIEEQPAGSPMPELIRLRMTLESGEEIDSVFRPPRLVTRGQSPSEEDEQSGENPEEGEGEQEPREP